jgi:serine/threonine-protein kinase
MTARIGDTIGKKYRIERLLGEGGMSSVWFARDLVLGRAVVLKLLHDEAGKARLLLEGQALARLRGEHVARVLDAEMKPEGANFLVLEYIEGKDLGTLVKERGQLPIELALKCTIQLCHGIAEAHAIGIIHRDIKPSNVILTTLLDGRLGIKIIDFGISKLADCKGDLTHENAILGSPYYMSPEQMRGAARADARSDIWSIGATLFVLLTGQYPYRGANVLEICAAILTTEAASPRLLRADISPVLDEVVRRCLARDPSERYLNVLQLAQALARCKSKGLGAQSYWLPPVVSACDRQALLSVAI